MTIPSFNVSVLTDEVPSILVRQKNGKKKEHRVLPMGIAAWRLWKTLQQPENQDDADKTVELLKMVCPDLSKEEIDIMTIPEASLVIITSMGGILKVIEAMGKEPAPVLTGPTTKK